MSFKIEIIATFGEKEFHFGDTTELRVGSGPFDNIKVKHAGIGECHLILKRRGDTVKVECKNTNGFFIQNNFMHVKAVLGYAFMEQTFDLHLGRSVNPKFKRDDPTTSTPRTPTSRWLSLRRPWLPLRRPWLALRRPWLALR